MKHLKNQNGSTLAITLMIMVIFTVLGFGLLTLNTSASKQFENTEQKVQARHFAEMGLVHYKSEAKIAIKDYNKEINTIRGTSLNEKEKMMQIESKSLELFNKLISADFINKINTNHPNLKYKISIKKHTYKGSDTLMDITVNSIGKSSEGKAVSIDLDFSLTHPGTGTVLADDVITFDNFTDLSDTPIVYSKKGNMIFNDSLIMDSFRVDGGNGLQMTVKKDLYLEGTLDVQNHACIIVQGNFTALTSITAINKFYLFVFGDAHLPSTINFNNGNNKIFVSGDVYINSEKIEPKPPIYSSVSLPFSEQGTTCSLPGTLDSQLIINEYRY